MKTESRYGGKKTAPQHFVPSMNFVLEGKTYPLRNKLPIKETLNENQ